jgi:macrodomain Ter protein organizer (MatP/YcbG family)
LVRFGVDSADDVREANRDRPDELYRAITKERGLGEAAATYFLMNLHVQGVKADVMIQRFSSRALGLDGISSARSRRLIEAAAEALQVEMLDLDHAIWDRESKLSQSTRRRRTPHSS